MQHLSAGACCAFLEKLYNEAKCLTITAKCEVNKRQHGDADGISDYIEVLQQVIVNQLRIVDKQVSLKKIRIVGASVEVVEDPLVSAHQLSGGGGNGNTGNRLNGNQGNSNRGNGYKGAVPKTSNNNGIGKIKNEVPVRDNLDNLLSKLDGSPLTKTIWVLARNGNGDTKTNSGRNGDGVIKTRKCLVCQSYNHSNLV